jgi:hypothetical protein
MVSQGDPEQDAIEKRRNKGRWRVQTQVDIKNAIIKQIRDLLKPWVIG